MAGNLFRHIGIVMGEIVPGTEELATEVVEWYLDRTARHIESVREFGRKAVSLLKDKGWCCLLAANLVNHDRDKLEDQLFIAHYAPYIVKRYCSDGLQDRFELADGYARDWDERYVVQHCMNNGHHPECWDAEYGYGENNPPYNATSMPPEYLAEMCCDWCAVGREQGNPAMEWFRKVNGSRFIFTPAQQEFISWLLRSIDG